MKLMNMKKFAALLAMILCFASVLGACGGSGEAEETTPATEASNEVEYRVTVADALGNPYTSGVVVMFLKDGQQFAMQAVDANGVAVKTMEKGEYTVDLVFTGDEEAYFYQGSELILTPENTELTVTLANAISGEASTLVVDGKDCEAYHIGSGCTYLTLTSGERNYFLYTPTEAGTYEFSISDNNAVLGYYGAPHFVQSSSAAEVVDNKFTLSIRADSISAEGATSVYVIGIDAGEVTECMLTIDRIGEPEWSIADEPYMIYEPTVELAPYILPAGSTLGEFDLTAATDTYNLVFNEADGFYHLDSAEGPLVLVRLGKNSAYLDSYKTIVEHTGVKCYFFDENGEFLKKEDYTTCVMTYLEYIDENEGVYPLTEDLKYIIQNHGTHSQWWDTEGPNYLFVDRDGNRVPGINSEIAWLFMCCYIAS